MKKKEILTFSIITVLLCVLVLVGGPGRNETGSSLVSVYADTNVTPTLRPTATPTMRPTSTPTPAPTGKVTPTPTRKVTPTPTGKATPTPTGKATPTPTGKATPTPTMIPEAEFKYISAYYTGSAVVVGDELDYEKLRVSAVYDDGSSIELKKGQYELPDSHVLKEGSNKFAVLYNGSTDTFYVQGKLLKSISASSQVFTYGQFNGVDPRDVTVTAAYSDGSIGVITDFEISPETFTESGSQRVSIMYRGQKAEYPVLVYDAREVKALTVTYTGKDLIQKQKIDRNDLTVTAVYNDAILSTEKIAAYTLKKESFDDIGEATCTVEFLGKTATCKINVQARTVEKMTAEYVGGDVEVGCPIIPKNVHVYLTYIDGSKEETDSYNIYDNIIRYLGENTIKIYHGDFMTTITVKGIEALPIDFSYTSEFSIRSGSNEFTITTALPRHLKEEDIAGKLLKKTKLTKAFRRLNSKNGWFCGFSYEFSDPDYELYLPVTVRITLPDDMEPEFTEVYYTPNLKSILGKMTKTVTDDGELEITIFKTGSYMIVYDPDAYLEDEEESEAEEEDAD